MDTGLLILRIVLGALFVGHGTQKVFGWFGGAGPDGTRQLLGTLGYPRTRQMTNLAGGTEAGSGVLLVLGLATPLAAAGIIGVMLNAGMAVHRGNGLWNSGGGFELPLVFGTAALALAFTGPGAVSLDAALGWPVAGLAPGLAALAVGMLGGLFLLATRRTAPATPQPEERQPAREREYAESRR